MFSLDIFHIINDSLIALLRINKVLAMSHVQPLEEEAYVFSRVINAA